VQVARWPSSSGGKRRASTHPSPRGEGKRTPKAGPARLPSGLIGRSLHFVARQSRARAAQLGLSKEFTPVIQPTEDSAASARVRIDEL